MANYGWTTRDLDNPISRALRLAGGSHAVAAHFEIRVNAVQRWIRRAEVPARRVYPLCGLIDFAILPGQLNSHFRIADPEARRRPRGTDPVSGPPRTTIQGCGASKKAARA